MGFVSTSFYFKTFFVRVKIRHPARLTLNIPRRERSCAEHLRDAAWITKWWILPFGPLLMQTGTALHFLSLQCREEEFGTAASVRFSCWRSGLPITIQHHDRSVVE